MKIEWGFLEKNAFDHIYNWLRLMSSLFWCSGVHLSATKWHFPPQTGKTVVRQVQLSLSLMIVCTMHPCSNFYTPIILSSNGADLQHTGSKQSSGEIFASWKVWNASPLLENGPNLNSRLFEWRLARGVSDAFLFIAKSRRRVLVSPTLQSRGGGLRPHGVQLSYAKTLTPERRSLRNNTRFFPFAERFVFPLSRQTRPEAFLAREREKGRN